ncbi:MAG: hypothetical protein EOO23_02760 [Comamonadaceae bacterium]|nr:MAG: hypothetical protein EOO23_02760 [Comamonadaceae bacterium]
MTSPTPSQREQIEQALQLVERLKQEAQIHAQEARTANATIAAIYQLVTGATGEPGNWNGAEPVRAAIASLRAQLVAAERDAARYRQLRRGQRWSLVDGIGNTLRAESLDAAVDAALSATQPQGDKHAS